MQHGWAPPASLVTQGTGYPRQIADDEGSQPHRGPTPPTPPPRGGGRSPLTFVSGQVPSSSESPGTDPEQKAPGSCPWPSRELKPQHTGWWAISPWRPPRVQGLKCPASVARRGVGGLSPAARALMARLKTHTPMPIRWCMFKTAGNRQFERTLQELGLLAKFCPTLGRDHFTYVCIGRESSHCSEGCLEATFAICLREFEEPYLWCSA